MGVITYKEKGYSNKLTSETWLFKLKANPVNGDYVQSVYSSEKIDSLVYRASLAMYDPFENRVIGILGGRLFNIHTKLPQTVERINPSGMNALELIEHLCQLQNCICYPNPTGYIDIISKTIAEIPININVKIMTQKDKRKCQSHYTVVTMANNDEEYYKEAKGDEGGIIYNFQTPFIFSDSQSQALADAYIQFYGIARRETNQDWKHYENTVNPSWSAVLPFQRIVINGDTTKQWYLMSLKENLVTKKASVRLIEAF